MKIKFYIPKDETIPLRLRLRVDYDESKKDIDVYYDKCKTGFAYEFCFWDDSLAEEVKIEIVKEIARIMSNQSYDHGDYWKIDSIKQTESDYDEYCKSCYRVDFHWHDAY